MTRFLQFRGDESDDPLFVNVDQIIAIRVAKSWYDEGSPFTLAKITVRDFEACQKTELVDWGSRRDKTPALHWNEFAVAFDIDVNPAAEAIREALTDPGPVIDMTALVVKYEALYPSPSGEERP